MSSDNWGALPSISVPVNMVLVVEDEPEPAEFVKSVLA